MEAIINDQSAGSASKKGSSKLRYPLRSASRSKEEKSAMADVSNSSASRRGMKSSCVSKSVSVLDLSAKDKSAKPPRRFSIPTKTAASPCPAPVGSRTPISETRTRRSTAQEKSSTPASEVSKSISRRKFSVISSVSYWLSQIKLSESASKHLISLGFFKLALQSGCEPLDRVTEELKTYICKHNLVTELEEPVKDVLQVYNIIEDFENLKVSENCPQLSEEGTEKLDKDAQSFSSRARTGNLKPKSLNSDAPTVAESYKKEPVQKRQPTPMNRGIYNKSPANAVPAKDNIGNNAQKKTQKSRKTDTNSEIKRIKSSPKKSATEAVDSLPIEEASCENKENMDAQLMDNAYISEEIMSS